MKDDGLGMSISQIKIRLYTYILNLNRKDQEVVSSLIHPFILAQKLMSQSQIASVSMQFFFFCFLLLFFFFLVVSHGLPILIFQPGIKPVPQQWKHGVLTTGSPANSLYAISKWVNLGHLFNPFVPQFSNLNANNSMTYRMFVRIQFENVHTMPTTE